MHSPGLSGELTSVTLCSRLDSDWMKGRTFGFPLFQIVFMDLHRSGWINSVWLDFIWNWI
jgi:hypothetical protein